MLYISIFLPIIIVVFSLYRLDFASHKNSCSRFFYIISIYFGGYFYQLTQEELFGAESIVLGACIGIGSFVQMVLKIYDQLNTGLTLTGYNMLFVFLDFVGFSTKVAKYLDFDQSNSVAGYNKIGVCWKYVMLFSAYIL